MVTEGKSLRDKGELSEAIIKFRSAQEKALQEQDFVYEAKIQILIGSTYTLKSDYRTALEVLNKAVISGEHLNNLLISGSASANIALLYWQLGDTAAAEARSRYAIAQLSRISKPDNFATNCLARAYLLHADVCIQQKKKLQGYRDYDAALALAIQNDDASTQALIYDERGVALMNDHRLVEANDSFRRTVNLCNGNPKADRLASAEVNLAELELEKENPDLPHALQLVNNAFTLSSLTFKATPKYYPLDIRGRILLKMNQKATALTEFDKAVEAATQWRTSALPGDTTNTQTVRQLQTVYTDYAQLAAEIAIESHNTQTAARALSILAENRAINLREQLQAAYQRKGQLSDEYFNRLAELQTAQAAVTLGRNSSKDQANLKQIRLRISDLENQIGLKSAKMDIQEERKPSRNSLRDIQRTLSRDQVLISVSLGKEKSYLWAVTTDKVTLSRLPGEEELTSKAISFAESIRLGRSSDQQSADMTKTLFSGLPPDIWNRSEWLMVADGALLNGFPFSALTDLQSATPHRFISECRSLRLLPSELLLTDRKSGFVGKRFLGIGDPIYNAADERLNRAATDAKSVSDGMTLARLVGSGKEIRSAANELQWPGAVLLTGARATLRNLATAAENIDGILHFAVHVVSPPDQPEEAALALSLNNGLPELLTAEAVSTFHVPGSLVILSGCSSGKGKVVPGAGLIGMSRSWLLAGAAAVVVSSWPTPDDSGKFFSAFYDHFDHLNSGDTAQRAALSLHLTQEDMIRGTGYRTSPSFWGAFSVIAKE